MSYNVRNRLFNKGERMVTKLNSLNELQEEAKTADGYMVGVTLIKDGNLTHYFLSDKFPYVDMLKSHGRVRDLILKQLEEDPRVSL